MADYQMPRDRDQDNGQYVPDYDATDFLNALRDLGGRAGTLDVAEAVGCHRDSARRWLNDLAEEGRIRRLDVGNAALWELTDEE